MTESDKDALIVSLQGINAMNGEQMEALESELDNFTAVSADVDDEIKWYKKMIEEKTEEATTAVEEKQATLKAKDALEKDLNDDISFNEVTIQGLEEEVLTLTLTPDS